MLYLLSLALLRASLVPLSLYISVLNLTAAGNELSSVWEESLLLFDLRDEERRDYYLTFVMNNAFSFVRDERRDFSSFVMNDGILLW